MDDKRCKLAIVSLLVVQCECLFLLSVHFLQAKKISLSKTEQRDYEFLYSYIRTPLTVMIIIIIMTIIVIPLLYVTTNLYACYYHRHRSISYKDWVRSLKRVLYVMLSSRRKMTAPLSLQTSTCTYILHVHVQRGPF